MAVVYKIYFKGSSKFYIGSSNNFRSRVSGHKSKLVKGVHENEYLQRMFDKYGDCQYELLEECSEDLVIQKEQEYINILKPDLNLNKIAGRPPIQYGDDHWLRSPKGLEYRKILSERVSGDNNPAKKPGVGDKISKSKKGRPNPKVSLLKKGKPGFMTGKHLTPEQIRNRTESRRKTGAGMKKISQFTLTGEFIKEWSSVTEAAESTGTWRYGIVRVRDGKQESAGEFIWK